jgi:hypothetical protein
MRVKASFDLFRRQDRHGQGIVLGATDLQDERAGRNLVLHGLANAVAIGRAAEPAAREGVSVLDQVDPGPRRQADGVEAGLWRGLEAREAGIGAAPGWLEVGFRDRRPRKTTRLRRRWQAIVAHFGAAGRAIPRKCQGLAAGAAST